MKFDVGIGAEQRTEPPAGREPADLIGQQQAPLAAREQHGGLLDVGNRRAPGAGLAQRQGELRRHRRLGVGATLTPALAPAQEEVAIGREGGLIEGERGQGKIAARRLPILAGDLLDRQAIDQGDAPRGR
ncbi:hypothetical protein ACQ5SK_40050 [Bradyrhizobium japonicum]